MTRIVRERFRKSGEGPTRLPHAVNHSAQHVDDGHDDKRHWNAQRNDGYASEHDEYRILEPFADPIPETRMGQRLANIEDQICVRCRDGCHDPPPSLCAGLNAQ